MLYAAAVSNSLLCISCAFINKVFCVLYLYKHALHYKILKVHTLYIPLPHPPPPPLPPPLSLLPNSVRRGVFWFKYFH